MGVSEELVGKTLAEGRYQIVRLLGTGGMGAVYQARQARMDRMVALKLIRAELVQSSHVVARFIVEMQVTARVEHPNTVRLFDFGETDGQLYLAMEFLAGKPLSVLLSEGRLGLARIVRIARQVANGLGAAHERGVIHRDLKPDNVMLLDSYGEPDFVKVLDFGIAKSLDEKTALTAVGSIIGTPAYMAPEQAMGGAVDARTDLYSLGVILYEMACGKVPFDAQSTTGMLVAQANDLPTPVLSVAPQTSPALAALIMQLLEKKPAARPESAAAVVARLDACLAGGAAEARSGRGRMWLAGAGVLGVAAIAATVAIATSHGGRAPDGLVGVDAGRASLTPASGPTTRPEPADRDEVDRVLAGLGLLAPEACRTHDAATVKRLLEAGRALAATPGQADLALTLLGDDDTPSTEVSLLRAQAKLDTGPAAAWHWATAATHQCPTWAAAYNLAGKALYKIDRLDQAEQQYRQAISLDPGYSEPRFNLGVLELHRKDGAAAAATATELLDKNPDNLPARLLRVQANLMLGHHDEALADLEEAVKRDPKSGDAWAALGELRERLQRGDALAAYCAAKKLGDKIGAAKCP